MKINKLICIASLVVAHSVWAGETESVIRVGSKAEQVLAAKITVADLRKSYDFYTKAVGLKEVDLPLPKPVFDSPEIAHTQAFLNFSGSPADPFLCLMKKRGVVPTMEQAQLTWLVIKTTSVKDSVTRIREMGLAVLVEPFSFMGVVVSLVRDPDGYIVELNEAATAAPSTSP